MPMPIPEISDHSRHPVLSAPLPARTSARPSIGAGALVTGADYRGLGIVRSLGRRGIPVWVLEADGQRLGATSRYALRSLRWPPSKDEQNQLDFLLDLAEKKGLEGWTVFPTTDEAVTLISRHYSVLERHFRLTTPPWDQLRWGFDKRLLNQLARDVGVDTPWTFCPGNRRELSSMQFPFPVILKPAMRLGFNRLTRDKAWLVQDHRSLLAKYDEACSLLDPELLMVQEVLPGWGESQFSYAAIYDDGWPLASVVAKRLRQFPMDFGRFSTYVETVEEPRLVELAFRLLASIRFTGMAELEFKRDPRDGKFKVMDLNPRVWGWHTLCARAGVDFSHLAWLQANGESVPAVKGRPAERWIRVGADLPMAIREILHGRLPLRDYLRSFRGPVEYSMFAWDDPVPGLLELPLIAAMVGRRFLQGIAV
jgi:D-aspartate ligase